MSNYPEYVPDDFIALYESGILTDFTIPTPTETPDELESAGLSLDSTAWKRGMSQIEVAKNLIFSKEMSAAWGALSERFNECAVPFFIYQLFIMEICEALKGPNDWVLLTPKEKNEKVSKIHKLAKTLYFELVNTPLDKNIMNYMRHEFYIDNFISNLSPGKRKEASDYLELFLFKENNIYLDKEPGAMFGFWNINGVCFCETSSILQDLFREAEIYECTSTIKRKTDAYKTFFIRKISTFFQEKFGTHLYEITASVSSTFLKREITHKDVRASLRST
ncbi:TPA: hypothetical protein ACPZSG_003461 [Yersinia enterocolitica]